jgi:hypothetical protein
VIDGGNCKGEIYPQHIRPHYRQNDTKNLQPIKSNFNQSKVTSTNQKELRKSTSYVEGNEGVTVAATAPK